MASGTHTHTVLYDGGCGLCKKTINWMRRLDWRNRLEYQDVLADWPAIQKRFPGLSQQACLESMHVVRQDGHMTDGFGAYRELAWALPLWWVLIPLLYFPGVSWIGRKIYARIADNRHRGGCTLPNSERSSQDER